MSSCYKKFPKSRENFMSFPRTPFDQTMMNMYNPTTAPYHAAPMPQQRTQFDLNVMKQNAVLCPNCSQYYTKS